MRRFLLGGLVLLLGMVGVSIYQDVSRQRAFQPLTTEGDPAA